MRVEFYEVEWASVELSGAISENRQLAVSGKSRGRVLRNHGRDLGSRTRAGSQLAKGCFVH